MIDEDKMITMDMPAGVELDTLVAVTIMELTPQVDFGTWAEHDWRKDDAGDIDLFATQYDHHNGPSCTRCLYGYCHHCQPGPSEPCEVKPPPYSGLLITAWTVVVRMAEWRTAPEARKRQAADRFGEWWSRMHLWRYAAPHAARHICLAALEAHRDAGIVA